MSLQEVEIFRWITFGLILGTVSVSGCSGGTAESEDRAREPTADSISGSSPSYPLAGHVTGDSAAAHEAPQTMVGMDHGSVAAPAATAEQAAHRAHTKGDGLDHSGHASVQSGTRDTAPGHAQHPAAQASATRTTAPVYSGYGRAGAEADQHLVHASSRATSSALRAAPAEEDPGMEKLMTLVAGLLRDSLVQRRIERDPVLREQWEEPGVRQILLGRR